MGKLIYGNANFDMSDRDAAYLDAVLTEACTANITFRFRFTVGSEGDSQIVAVTLGPGIPAVIEFPNADNGVEWGYVVAAMKDIRETGHLSLGFFSGL